MYGCVEGVCKLLTWRCLSGPASPSLSSNASCASITYTERRERLEGWARTCRGEWGGGGVGRVTLPPVIPPIPPAPWSLSLCSSRPHFSPPFTLTLTCCGSMVNSCNSLHWPPSLRILEKKNRPVQTRCKLLTWCKLF